MTYGDTHREEIERKAIYEAPMSVTYILLGLNKDGK